MRKWDKKCEMNKLDDKIKWKFYDKNKAIKQHNSTEVYCDTMMKMLQQCCELRTCVKDE